MCCLSVVLLRIELMHVSDSTVRWCGAHYMTYSVPSTSTWCHLGGSYIHISYVFITFCKMKAYTCNVTGCTIIMPDWNQLTV